MQWIRTYWLAHMEWISISLSRPLPISLLPTLLLPPSFPPTLSANFTLSLLLCLSLCLPPSLSRSLFLLLGLPPSIYISPGPVRAQASAPRCASRLPIVVHLPKKSASPGRLCWNWRRAPRGFSARAPGARRLPVFRFSAEKGLPQDICRAFLPNSISCLSRNSMF